MPKTLPQLITRLAKDFPEIHFVSADIFAWTPTIQTVRYDASSDDAVLLLHELGHGLLNHTTYGRDVSLLHLERDAWDKARELASTYAVPIDEDAIEQHLDSYRQWIHERSTCPTCGSNGLQTKQDTYTCPACDSTWRVNEARTCALRRYKVA